MSDIAAHMNDATRQARVIDGLPDGLALRRIEKVGIIGAGTMGGGIAMNYATAAGAMTIVETKAEALERISKSLKVTTPFGRARSFPD